MSPNELGPIAPTRTRQRNNSPSKKANWTPEEDAKLSSLASNPNKLIWTDLASYFPGKTSQQVMERWTKVLDPSLLKGSWTRQEDEIIINYVAQYGTKSWTKLAERLPGRIGKQCRERWINHLNPSIDHSPWTPEEDKQLEELHDKYGNKWVKISALMPGRSDNAIKNRWNSTLNKRLQTDKTLTKMAKDTGALPKPQIDDSMPMQEWSIQSTPRSVALISPILSNPLYYMCRSPMRNGDSSLSPLSNHSKSILSPTRSLGYSSSLLENRSQLLNLISNQ